MTAVLGYALWGLYRAHNEERKTWLEKWEAHFQRLLDTLRESDKARHELAEEVRAHLRSHDDINQEIRQTLDRIAEALDR
jgi:septal ring factor EnvC (AmiA/AmiB activator)